MSRRHSGKTSPTAHHSTGKRSGGLVSAPPPAFVSSSSGSTNGQVTSLVVNAPATITSGNLLVAVLYWVGNATSVLSSAGWTNVAQGGVGTQSSTVFTKTAGASEPASYTFSSTSAIFWTAIIEQWSGTPNGVDGTPGFNAATATTSGTAPSVTATGSADIWIVGVGDDNQTISPSTPTGMTARTNVKNATSGLGLWLYDKALSSSGATGAASFTFGSAVDYGSSSLLIH